MTADRKMMTNSGNRAADLRETFLAWARRSAIPMPASHEEPLSNQAQVALGRMLEGKRFVFLGEPEHCIVEKYLFRLTLIRYLFGQGWRHVSMETGRSMGWRVDQYLATGDASRLHADVEPPGAQDVAIDGKMLEFIDEHEDRFHEQLRRIRESRERGTPRLHYWGYDLDLGIPPGSVEPIRRLLEGHASRQVHELLSALDGLRGLPTDEQSVQVEALQNRLTASVDIAPDGTLGELQSWLASLHDSVAAEKRPRENQAPRGHQRWRVERERLMMKCLDAIVDALGPEDGLVLMGHYGHLSKDAAHLRWHPQISRFWGLRSWLGAWGYRMLLKLIGLPVEMGDSVGAHLHRRFPGQVLSIWMLYGQGSLMTPTGPRDVRLRSDTAESLLAQVGDRFLLPLNDVAPQARMILSHANIRSAGGLCVSADLTAQAEAIYFIREVKAK